MAADEQETQHVVLVGRGIESLSKINFRVIEIRQNLLGGKPLALARSAQLVERKVAPDQDQPGSGVARRALLRPVLEGAQAGFLERLIGNVKIAEIAQQRSECLGSSCREGRMDPGDVGHVAKLPGSKLAMGRIS